MSTHSHPMRALFAACLLVVSGSVASQVHMWKDAEGRTHYSDVPPPDVSSKELDIKVTPMPGNAQPAQRTQTEQNDAFQQRRTEREEEQAKVEEESARKAKLERQCADAERRLVALEGGQRIVRFNDKGEREFLNDEQRKEEAEQLRGLIEERCKKP